jgi:hypothetical protein
MSSLLIEMGSQKDLCLLSGCGYRCEPLSLAASSLNSRVSELVGVATHLYTYSGDVKLINLKLVFNSLREVFFFFFFY